MSEADAPAAQEGEHEELVIRSEAEAWAVLERAVSGGEFPATMRLRFDGWPSFELDVSGRDWHSTVPTRVMPALLDVQRDIHRAYVNVQYRESNLKRLREEERNELELVVKVKEGSSSFSADLWEQFTRIAEAAITRMSGTQAVITVLGLALVLVSPVLFKAWLRSRQEEKRAVRDVELSEQETERLRIVTQAMQQQPIIVESREDAMATANRLLKATHPGDTMDVAGVPVSAEEARELVQPERERAKEIDIEGVFSIISNRTDRGDGFRITVRRESDQLTFHADVPLDLGEAEKQLIQAAEWSKGRIFLTIEADMLRNAITRAVVTHATAVEGERPLEAS